MGLVLYVSVAFPLISPLFHTLYYQFKGVFWWWQNSISVPLTRLGPLHSWFFSHPSFTVRGYCYLLNWLKVYNYVYVIFMYAWKFVFSDWGSGLQFMCVACSWLGRCHCMVRFFLMEQSVAKPTIAVTHLPVTHWLLEVWNIYLLLIVQYLPKEKEERITFSSQEVL